MPQYKSSSLIMRIELNHLHFIFLIADRLIFTNRSLHESDIIQHVSFIFQMFALTY